MGQSLLTTEALNVLNTSVSLMQSPLPKAPGAEPFASRFGTVERRASPLDTSKYTDKNMSAYVERGMGLRYHLKT